eukprot:4073331-Alexandrium_andersonii.AAC.1
MVPRTRSPLPGGVLFDERHSSKAPPHPKAPLRAPFATSKLNVGSGRPAPTGQQHMCSSVSSSLQRFEA